MKKILLALTLLCLSGCITTITVDGEIMATGINGKQSAKFGDIANGK